MLDVRRLEVLLAVAEQGSIAAAALTFTPPAVSQQIVALEPQVGAPLVDRVDGPSPETG
jgi:DNA-binding transcriptional LysR family regulator